MNKIELRDALRTEILEALKTTFPTAERVKGGLAFLSDKVDEATGKLVPVVISVTLPQTKDTTRSKAYDLDAAVEEFKAAPGRRIADPEKKAEAEARKAAAAARREADLEVLRAWVEENAPERMVGSIICAAIPEFAKRSDGPMTVGRLLRILEAEGVVEREVDERRHPIWTYVG